ncbi:MAG: molecular chaperone DnaJ [Acidobacteriota bacterium]|nr:molecular chaperone DnaJ [Acidobacteriota bacterium]
MPRDYYEVLGLDRSATLQEIKSAYRKLAVRYHPDRNPGDSAAEEKFKEAADAYAVLSDVDKRQRYDRFGHQATPGGGGFDPTIFADFSDILGDVFGFGGRTGGRRRRAGADLRYDLRISFEEAAFGVEPKLRIPRLERCETCGGSGAAPGTGPIACRMCGGRGQVQYSQGFFSVARTCPDCRGAGSVIRDPCPDCRGQGRSERQRSIQVRVPAGVDTGSRLRLPGEGEHGRNGGPPGDLYVVIGVEPHERFSRRDADVLSSVTIGFPQAVLGCTVDVETLHGTSELEVPPATPHGSTFVLRSEGIPRIDGRGRGNHIVEVRLNVPRPRDLSEDELEHLRALAELSGHGDGTIRDDRGLFSRVKDLFSGHESDTDPAAGGGGKAERGSEA